MVTMTDVAQAAGVSITTVSHVLNRTRAVHKDTADRVWQAIRETGYTPNTIARALAGARTMSIGLAISGISNPYFMDVIAAIEAATAREGYTLLLVDTHDEEPRELQAVETLVQRRVDGLLLAPSPGASRSALPYLAGHNVPTVILDRFIDADIDQVGVENEEPTAALVDHLAGHGHRRIGFIAGLPGLSTTIERLRGYQAGVARNGLPRDEALLRQGASSRDPARAAVLALLQAESPPTALITANNFMTIGAVSALHGRGLRVPEDIALAAFDDFEWASIFHPRLTAIAQPTHEIGQRAVDLLLARIADPEAPTQHVRLAPQLMCRESCGCERDAGGG